LAQRLAENLKKRRAIHVAAAQPKKSRSEDFNDSIPF